MSTTRYLTLVFLAALPLVLPAPAQQSRPGTTTPADNLTPALADGYRGIWYMNQPLKDEHRYNYSGGFATYPQQHAPIAIYVASQKKTFFVYGGSAGKVSVKDDELQHLVSYYDHATGTVPRPVRILQKRTEDAHDNPVLSLDAEGHLIVFSAAHGTSRPAYIHRSKRPYDITEWELLEKTNFSYPQPWFLPESKRFLFLHTIYKKGERTLNWKVSTATSADARGWGWSGPQLLAHMEMGDYQVSARHGETDLIGTAFDLHPEKGRAGTGLNFRTNLYYAQTRDGGQTWTGADGKALVLPLTDAGNAALVRDYRAEDRNVYLKEVAFTAEGRPVILYLTSKGFQPGAGSGPYQWYTARWTGEGTGAGAGVGAGSGWEIREFTTSDHNYDHGPLYIEADGMWRVIAPTDPGPQPWGTGGDLVMWTSENQGGAWKVVKRMTGNSKYNHTYVRKPVNAHPDFYALWADGSPLEPTPSSLYFCNKGGDVFRLPVKMDGDTAKPEPVK